MIKRFLYLATAFILFLNFTPVNAEAIKELKSCPCQITVSSVTTPKSIDNLVGHFDNKIKIIFSDIDGTLIPLDKNAPQGQIPESVKQSAQKLKKAQIPLILVTGRSSWEAKQIAKITGCENAYVIAIQGGEILNPEGKIIYQDNINNKDVRKILKTIELFNKLHRQNSKVVFMTGGKYYSKESTIFPYYWQVITTFKSLNEFEPNFTSCKIMVYEPNTEKLKLIQTRLKKDFPNYHIDMVADCYCDITGSTATKGKAIQKLADTLGVDLKNAAVFGDSENDISMLKEVKANGGLAVAVGNAMDSVKNNANFVTSPVDKDGFAKAVDKILINNSLLK